MLLALLLWIVKYCVGYQFKYGFPKAFILCYRKLNVGMTSFFKRGEASASALQGKIYFVCCLSQQPLGQSQSGQTPEQSKEICFSRQEGKVTQPEAKA